MIFVFDCNLSICFLIIQVKRMDNPPTDSPLPRKRTSNAVGWDYGVLFDAQFPYKVKCKLCRKEFSIGVCKMKEHIGHLKGNVADCPMSTKEDQEKFKKAIAEAKNKKSIKNKHEEA